MDDLFVDRNGDYIVDQINKKTIKQTNDNSQIFTTAETIDIAEGADSDNPHV